MTLQRVTTGIPELDSILRGGIPRFATVFVAGPPGSGKTVLCQQALFANAQRSVPALYLGTLSEPVLKMIRHAQEFSFFKPGILGQGIVFNDIGDSLKAGGGEGLIREVDRLVKEHRPEFLVIDSFKVIREYFTDAGKYRQFVSELVARLNAWEVTAFLIGEYSSQEILYEPEFAIADGILYLYGTEEPERQKRFLRVMKMRGTDYFSGEHLFEITPGGIEVYPRMDPSVSGEYAIPDSRLKSAIPGLNEMTRGGLGGASCAIIRGGSGTGKTLCAMSFLVAGAQDGLPGLFVSFEERPEQIIRHTNQFGWNVDKLVDAKLLEIMHVPPSELDLDKHASIIQKKAQELKAATVVIDTMSALEDAENEGYRAHNYLWAISDYFKRIGTTVIMTYESSPAIELVSRLDNRLSFLADVILNLKQVEVDGIMRKTIGIIKMRGVDHDRTTRELSIANSNIRVGDPFVRTTTNEV